AHRGLRHPQHLRGGVPFRPRRGDVGAARSRRAASGDRRAAPADRRVACHAEIRRLREAALRAPGAGERDGRAAAVKWAAPIAVGVLALVLWQALVKALDVPHYLVPSPLLVAQTLV